MLLYLLNENCPKILKSLVGGGGGRDEVKNQKSCLIDLTTRHAHAHTHTHNIETKKKFFVRENFSLKKKFFFPFFYSNFYNNQQQKLITKT